MEPLLVISALLLVGLFIFNVPGRLFRYYVHWKAVRNIPGLPAHWLFGNLLDVRKMLESEEEYHKVMKYAVKEKRWKMVRTWIGPFQPSIDIYHCSLAGKVLKQPKNAAEYRLFKPWLGDGLLISKGSKWARNRRLLTPAFHYEILKPYVPVYNNCVKELLDKWTALMDKNKQIELFNSISLLSLDIILQCSFSFSSNCQDTTQSHPYIEAVQELVELTTERFVTLVGRIDWLFNLTPTGRKYNKLCQFVHSHSRMVVQKRKEELEVGKTGFSESELRTRKKGKYLDFLDVLLIARDEDGNGLTDQEIQDEVDTFMFEGHDTTTSGMCWTLYCLAKHPEAQEKVREEVRSVLQGRDTLDYDDLKELKYTQWAIKEAMRLYPPVFFIFRKATEEMILDGHIIPKGMNFGIGIRQIHRHPETWENPDEYDPLRFHPSNCEGRDPYAYIPFSGGQRNCIGQNFALNEERIVIASILNRFKLSLVQGHKVETAPKVVLRSKNGIKINLEPL
ncbi:ultra-long-chain fatty acid omega-hydroxylase-like [Halichondria panicea]|uniref:ultra-long-chain fatty acid omega-hydroxylase-like n=1 Tax=Halichondria panicea TaxID=6063 RepID=UPI00312BC73E